MNPVKSYTLAFTILFSLASVSYADSTKKYGHSTVNISTDELGEKLTIVSIDDNSGSDSLNFRCGTDGFDVFFNNGVSFNTSYDSFSVKWKFDKFSARPMEYWSASTNHGGLFVPYNSKSVLFKQALKSSKLAIYILTGPAMGLGNTWKYDMKGFIQAAKSLDCIK